MCNNSILDDFACAVWGRTIVETRGRGLLYAALSETTRITRRKNCPCVFKETASGLNFASDVADMIEDACEYRATGEISVSYRPDLSGIKSVQDSLSEMMR